MTDKSEFEIERVPILVRASSSEPEREEYLDVKVEDEEGGVVQHARLPFMPRKEGIQIDEGSVSFDSLQASFVRIQRQVHALMEAEDLAAEGGQTVHGFKVQEVTAKLGLSAKGGLAFIAEAGIEASIEVKFSRS
ncbi:hypothetical protein ACH4E5_02250 [Streptomyces afghaniensis]|uniref:Pepco domain-containing protein n=1 Tax=Streptomyces afghaniensis TaxID=66865 RepID=UPI00379E4899